MARRGEARTREGDIEHVAGRPAVESSGRPKLCFLVIKIENSQVRALVDSGALACFMSREWAEERGLEHRKLVIEPYYVTLANGHVARAEEQVDIELTLDDRTCRATARILSSLIVPFILGIDGLKKLGLVIDYANSRLCFAERKGTEFEFYRGDGKIVMCNGIQELEDDQRERLQVFLKVRLLQVIVNPGVTTLVEHKIAVGNHPPIKQRHYLVSPKVQQAVHEEIDRLLAEGIIEPSASAWSNPIVMVPKPNGKYRFCLDFRKVKEVSRKDAYPLPLMTGILDKLRSAQYISTLDLSQAYFQIPLEKSSREITAFAVPGRGLFQFIRMPYGLTDAPATFQRLVDTLIGPEMDPYAFAYLDDMIIVTETFDEHLEWLGRVLDKITEAGLVINPEKCKFCRSEVRYLGFLVNSEGLKVDRGKVAPILEFPPPKALKLLRRFIGMTSWYRPFIPQYATIAEPLCRLLKDRYRWQWGPGQ